MGSSFFATPDGWKKLAREAKGRKERHFFQMMIVGRDFLHNLRFEKNLLLTMLKAKIKSLEL